MESHEIFLKTTVRLGRDDLYENLHKVFCGEAFADCQFEITDSDASIEELVKHGAVCRFFDFLDREDLSVKFEAAWASTNIASGTSDLSKCAISPCALQKLITLYKCSRNKYQLMALRAFGNMASDSLQRFNLEPADVCCEFFLAMVTLIDRTDLHVTRTVSRTLYKFCFALDRNFSQKRGVYSVLRELFLFEDVEVLTDACWALANTYDNTVYDTRGVIRSNLYPRLTDLLTYRSSSIIIPVLLTLGKIVSGNDKQSQHDIDQNVLPKLRDLLKNCDNQMIAKLTCFVIATITSHGAAHVKAIIRSDLVGPLVDLLSGNTDCKEEAVLAIMNCATDASPLQIQHIVNEGCIKPLCDLLTSENHVIIKHGLKALDEILKGTDADEYGVNKYKTIVADVGGLDNIRKLEFHHDCKIFDAVVELLDKYWVKEEYESIFKKLIQDVGLRLFSPLGNLIKAEVLRGVYSLPEIRKVLDGIDDRLYRFRFLDINREHKFFSAEGDSSNPLLARKLVEVFKVKVYNLTENDVEIYGTVELLVEDYRSRYIYYRDDGDCVLVKGNGSAYLLLNGPNSVFGLDSCDLHFDANLCDKRDGHLIHVGSKMHPTDLPQKVMTIRLGQFPLSYDDDTESHIPKNEEWERRYSLRMALTYIVYDHAIAAYLKVYFVGGANVSLPVYGFITAATDLFPDHKSLLFMKMHNGAPSVAHGCQIELSKSVVAVPCDGKLLVKVSLPGIANGKLEFPAKQHGKSNYRKCGKIKVCITWQLRCENYIEAIQEKVLPPPQHLSKG